MKILYILLSSTFGMHQYTSDLANRALAIIRPPAAVGPYEPNLLTTTRYHAHRYAPHVRVYTPVSSKNSGIEPYTLNAPAFRRVVKTILEIEPDLVHFTGPHLWNVPLLRLLRRHNIPTIHTIHDLDPHHGMGYGRLLHLWNELVIRYANVILLHGKRYHQRLLNRGIPPHRLAYTPILHLFLGHHTQTQLQNGHAEGNSPPHPFTPSPLHPLRFLFFGRLLPYKGLDDLLHAWTLLQNGHTPSPPHPFTPSPPHLTIAGPGPLPSSSTSSSIHIHNDLIDDQTALQLFRATDLLLLPYHDATQSALVAAAYYFKKPVLVTRTGALPEYVQHHKTGYIVNPCDPQAIAAALTHAIQNPHHLRQMGQNGHTWYQTQRAQEQKTIQTLYHSLLNHNHHPP